MYTFAALTLSKSHVVLGEGEGDGGGGGDGGGEGDGGGGGGEGGSMKRRPQSAQSVA